MIFGAVFKAVGQIGDPRFRRVLLLGVGLTLALLIAATVGVVWFIQWLSGDTAQIWVVGEVSWIDDLLSVAGLGIMLLLSIVLMVPVASAITSIFLDEVAQAVEDRHYPALPRPEPQSMGEAFKDSVNFLGVIMAANIVALFFYALFAPFAPFIFWALNGYLLGMEYFQLAAMRRIGRTNAKALRKAHRGTIWAAGALMAIPLTVPVVNLVVPILGAATFTHIFHKINARKPVPAA